MMRRALVPAIVLLLILIYVPGVGPSMTSIAHSTGHILSHVGAGLGDFLHKVAS